MKARSLLALLVVVLALAAVPMLSGAATTVDVASAASGPNAPGAAKPTKTPRPTATATQTRTSTPTRTAPPLPTATPLPTDTPAPTDTVAPADTPTPGDSPTPTDTVVPADTVVPTGTPVPSPSPEVAPIYWGVSMAGVPDDMSPLVSWETNVTGKTVSIVHWGHFWMTGRSSYQAWNATRVNNARSHGAIPMISWTPEGGSSADLQLIDIINGNHDAYIRQFATDAKNWGHPFFLRMMHEMNGTWGYNWQETQNGNKSGEFVQAWRHIVDLFRQVGATNATYVWCPNIEYSPTSTFAHFYPGDDYVDWTCLDGYNWSTVHGVKWQTFDEIFHYSYGQILAIAPLKPMMIGEFGSVEDGAPAGTSKAAWFADALTTQIPDNYKQIRAHVYYNRIDGAADWRVETSQAAQDAWKAAIAAPYYPANIYGSFETSPIPVP